MIWSDDQLSGEVGGKTRGNKLLARSVKLLGPVAHENIEAYYHSADYFVLGSHYEGSGYALSEALRCGCVPIVTNIPSFKMITGDGKLGALWNAGDKNSFVEAAKTAMNKPLVNEEEACIKFFREHLSFDAIAEKAIVHYQKLIERRSRK